jgi:hypothetical protein
MSALTRPHNFRRPGALESDLDESVQRIETQLATDRPWRDIANLETDLAAVRAAYITERQRLLEWQEQQREQARGRIKAGFIR